MQIKTNVDGVTWARWIDESLPLVTKFPPGQTASPGGACASCNHDRPEWKDIPQPAVMPRGELMYECKVCGKTTREGRYAQGDGDTRAGFGGSRNPRSSN
jgi:hypothetical protein